MEDDAEENTPPSQARPAMPMWGSSPSPSDDDDESPPSSPSPPEHDTSLPTSTLGMQETVAMALAHSLNCGLALIDDVALDGVRTILAEEYPELGLGVDAVELRTSSLVGHLIRLANGGRLTEEGGGRLSDRMERDLALGLDDPYDELAVESLKLMREEEDMWFEAAGTVVPVETTDGREVDGDETEVDGAGDGEDDDVCAEDDRPLSLVLFLRTNACTQLLRSKSAVDRLARECVNEDSIHLLMLGRGIDATTTNLPQPQTSSGSGGGMPPPQRARTSQSTKNRNDNAFWQNGSPPPGSQQQQQQQQPNGNNPFNFLSSSPPPPNTKFTLPNQPPPNAPQQQQNNINASGANDPDGSRRFNIFLARTTDKDGTPGIMGAIAPPQAGNLFPQMLHMHAVDTYRQSQADGDSEEDQRKHEAAVERWTELMEQHSGGGDSDGESGGGDDTSPAYFKSSIGGPEGNPNGTSNPMNNNNNFDGMVPPQPEMIQKAIEEAVTDVMQSLSRMGDESDDEHTLPPHLAQAFSHILSNENLRRGIAENLSRAAPALVDPRCQGVMLSVYVPPGPEHPNRGLMPGQQRSQQGQKGSSSKRQQNNGPGAMTRGWLNKILSSSPSSNSNDEHSDVEDEDDEAASDVEEEDDDVDEVDSTERSSITGDEDDSTDSGNSSNQKSGEDINVVASAKESTSKPPSKRSRKRQARVAAVAAATAMLASNDYGNPKDRTSPNQRPQSSSSPSTDQKVQKHLTRLQALCRSIPLRKPADPVRLRSWESWAARERGAIIFRKNRRVLNAELSARYLRIKNDADGSTRGMGSILRQMLSVKDLSVSMEDVIECAIETEAARSQMLQESPWDTSITKRKSPSGRVDPSLEQLLPYGSRNEVEVDSTTNSPSGSAKKIKKRTTSIAMAKLQYIHPKSIEKALSTVCRISPSLSGSSSSSSTSSSSSQTAIHRTREEISELAKDKHERALVSQVVSPQDIGVSYDMIGGLFEVKELLRQSITYPLKFPHLYNEGIAREAVKGVLLFGPPGTGE